MNYTKSLLIILSIFLAPMTILAGKESGGGGDPYSQQFVDLGYKLGEFFNLNPFNLNIPFSAQDFVAKIKIIDDSIKDEIAPDKLEFTDDKLTDKDGVEKSAVFDRDTNSIQANRRAWRNYSIGEKLVQVTMEVSGLLGAPLRYENAAALVESRSSIISKIIINEKTEYKIPGWRVVSGDADEFSRLTKNDIIIDGGILGDGDQNHPAAAFFKQPLANKQWIEKIFTGWVNGSSAAYFLVAAPNHERTVLASIQIIQDANDAKNHGNNLMARVYLINFERNHTVFTGPCANPEKLSPLERIKTCYLDLQTYYPTDDLISTTLNKNASNEKIVSTIEELVKQMGVKVTTAFAKNQKTVLAALREYYITDYSRTLIPYHGFLLETAAKAHGLVPSLVGSFGETAFWVKTSEVDKADLKLYKATQALAENELVFTDFNVYCEGLARSTLVKRKRFLELERQRKCHYTSVGGSIVKDLYKTMNENGFTYDEEKSKWVTQDFKL